MEKKPAVKTRRSQLSTDLDRIAKMNLAELRQLHQDLFGSDSRIPNSEHLRRKIAWHVQAEKEGGLPESARQHALAIARQVELRVRVCGAINRRQNGTQADRAVT